MKKAKERYTFFLKLSRIVKKIFLMEGIFSFATLGD